MQPIVLTSNVVGYCSDPKNPRPPKSGGGLWLAPCRTIRLTYITDDEFSCRMEFHGTIHKQRVTMAVFGVCRADVMTASEVWFRTHHRLRLRFSPIS